MKKKIVFAMFLLSATYLHGQNEVHSKITVLSGNSVYLPFNSYTKMNDGMEYTDWTRLRILYFDTIPGGSLDLTSRWELLVRANTANIPGDGGTTPMNLDKVELLIGLTTDDGTITSVATHTITNTDTQVVGNGANPTGRDIGVTIGRNTEVLISYRVGRNGVPPAANTLLGEDAGYYFVDLIFTLQKE